MDGQGRFVDTVELRGHAGRISGGVGSVRQLIEDITDLLDGIYWEGADKKRFLQDWNGQLRPHAAQVLQAMQDSASALEQQAEKQEILSQHG